LRNFSRECSILKSKYGKSLRRSDFSKVSSIVILQSISSSGLTFEKFSRELSTRKSECVQFTEQSHFSKVSSMVICIVNLNVG